MEKAFLMPHGGNVYEAAGRFGIPVSKFLDYSANINPLGVPGELKSLIMRRLDDIVNYPDPKYSQLIQRISDYVKVPKDGIIVGNGATEIIALFFDAIKPGRVVIPVPSFSEYHHAAKRGGAVIDLYPLREEQDFQLDVDHFSSWLPRGTECVVLCNPNNPTSTLLTMPQLLRLARKLEDRNILLILDEAFIELTEGGSRNSLLSHLEEFPHVFIIRAFTKIFAIPGIRLGYGIGNRDVIDRLKEKQLPWTVNAFAEMVGDYLPLSAPYLTATQEWLSNEKDRFYARLKELKNYKVYQPMTNFILIKILSEKLNSHQMVESLAQKGVLIRDASNFHRLSNKYFRIAVKDPKSNALMVELLKSYENIE